MVSARRLPAALAMMGAGLVSCTMIDTGAVGPVGRPVSPDGPLEVRVESDRIEAPLGDTIPFTARIRNAGDRAVWMPREPLVVFTWRYPNGQRDNYMFTLPQAEAFTEVDAQMLEPDGEIVIRTEISTRYVPVAGITEFGAVMILPTNTNAALAPFAQGTYRSSRFGVHLADSNHSASGQAQRSDGFPPAFDSGMTRRKCLFGF